MDNIESLYNEIAGVHESFNVSSKDEAPEVSDYDFQEQYDPALGGGFI